MSAHMVMLYSPHCLQSYEQADLDEWEMSWGQSPPSLHTSAEHDDTSSSVGSGEAGYEELLETLVPNCPANGALPVLSNQENSCSPLPPETNQEEPFKLLSVEDSSQHVEAANDLTSFCDCPPDPEFPLNTDVRLLSLTEILQHPMEVARQLTLLEHSKLCRISREELLQRIHFLPRATSEPPSASQSPKSFSSSSMVSVPEVGVEKLAYHFNRLANWVANSVLQYHTPEDRAWIMAQFIEVAQHCRSYHNFSSMMAIIVAGLLSPSIRRLKRTWMVSVWPQLSVISQHSSNPSLLQYIPKVQTERFKYMENLLSSKNNYKNYRDVLEKTTVPAVPFVGELLCHITVMS